MGITLTIPVVALLLLELTLRAVQYGPDLSLFFTEEIRGTPYHVMNPAVKGRYFSRVAFRPSTSPDYFLVPKPADTYRIFCLGGSTTAGYPFWYNGSFSSYLRDRLRAMVPGMRIEVINVGMTATNSFTVLDMARDIMDFEPNLLVVYDGHNEFYGALGVASHESFHTPRWLTLLGLRALRFRTVLLVRDMAGTLLGLFSETDAPRPLGTMMEKLARGQYIPYGSTTYWEGVDIFRENVGGLADLCERHGVPLLLGTQVSNLRDQPPFVSGDPHGDPEDRRRFHAAVNAGLTFMMNAAPDSALRSFQRASSLDSTNAEPYFQIGRCLEMMGSFAEAASPYRRARDLDQLRFRASTDLNKIILEAAHRPGVAAVDMEAVFAAASPDSLIGFTLIFEHLHPRSRGYFLMARAYAEAIRRDGFLAPEDRWRVPTQESEERLWERRPVTELDERTAQRRTDVLTSGWPFTDQFPIVDAIDESDTLEQIAEELTRGMIGWPQAHTRAAEYYVRRGDLAGAEREFRAIVNQLPLIDVQPYLKLARVLLEKREYGEMREVLRSSLEVEPTILAYRALADIALNTGRPGEAAAYYQHTFDFPQSPAEQAENGHLLALAYLRAGNRDEALAQLQRVLRIAPEYEPSRRLLQELQSTLPRPVPQTSGHE
jgi:tetratricopeptide (TPR) repeat protein